jgi:hypothetical protein
VVGSYPVHQERDLPLTQLAVGGVLIAPLLIEGRCHLTFWKRGSEEIKRIVFEEIEIR